MSALWIPMSAYMFEKKEDKVHVRAYSKAKWYKAKKAVPDT